MNAQELISRYNITRFGDKIRLYNTELAKKDGFGLSDLVAAKPEIMAFLLQQEAEKEAARIQRQRKIEAIPGLAELKNSLSDWEEYRIAFNKFIENDAIGRCPKKPESDPESLKRDYPMAAAYIHAESYSLADHYAKASAGRNALERIISGDPYADAISDMEQEWNSYLDEHIWD